MKLKESGLIIGKDADITAVNLNSAECQPVYNVISQLVYSCTADKVSDVWIAGKRMLENRQLCTLDETSIIQSAQAWAAKIQKQS